MIIMKVNIIKILIAVSVYKRVTMQALPIMQPVFTGKTEKLYTNDNHFAQIVFDEGKLNLSRQVPGSLDRRVHHEANRKNILPLLDQTQQAFVIT
jgi:hypothetical protein